MLEILKIKEEMLEKVASLYNKVWSVRGTSFLERLQKHMNYEGFTGFVIVSEDGDVIGYSYGYTSLPEQYYHGLLSNEFNSEDYQKWLTDCFEFVELAVHPGYRKQGHANQLITKLLDGVGHKTAILTTQQNNFSARKLYESLHWVLYKETFYPGDKSNPFVIMVKKLR
ncbi:GNAT family N-acetyltransferase [Bacillus salitolerans]|uniref:GNAT family N-acetyltransferase n=1 Tax=Bacillus salitolerans TaxID=1437434 RepID=A0ABW4LWQ4_9BACI